MDNVSLESLLLPNHIQDLGWSSTSSQRMITLIMLQLATSHNAHARFTKISKRFLGKKEKWMFCKQLKMCDRMSMLGGLQQQQQIYSHSNIYLQRRSRTFLTMLVLLSTSIYVCVVVDKSMLQNINVNIWHSMFLIYFGCKHQCFG